MPRKLKVGESVRCGWYDHFLVPGTWVNMDQDQDQEEARCYSYGIVVKDEPLYYTIAGSVASMVDKNGTVTGQQFGDVNRILKSAIFEVKRIK